MSNKPNTDIIEMTSINKLKDCLLRTEVIKPYINENDKIPSWDGELLVYNSKSSFCKDKLMGRIPIQVKGEWVEHFSKKAAAFQAELSDLRNYYNDGGIIFFYIQIKDYDHFKIYYTLLLPFDLKKLLKAAAQQKTKSIHLEQFPHSHPKEIIRIFSGFLSDKKKQGIVLQDVDLFQNHDKSQLNTIDNFEFSIPGAESPSSDDAIDWMLRHPIYVYAKMKKTGILYPFEKMLPDEITTSYPILVKANGEILYDHIDEIRHGHGKKQFKLGNNITITWTPPTPTMNILFNSSVKEQIADLKFVSAIMQGMPVTIGDKCISKDFIFDWGEHNIDEVTSRLTTLFQINETLVKLHVEQDLYLNTLTESELKNLSFLVKGILNKEPVPLSVDGHAGAGKLKIGNIGILLYSKKDPGCNGYFINDFFAMENFILTPKKALPENSKSVSPYILLSEESFGEIDNICINEIAHSITKFPYSDLYGDRILLFLLELLKVYDKCANKTILDTVVQLLDFLDQNNPSNKSLYELNRLQTEKRRRSLTEKEIDYLIQLKQQNVTPQYLLAANILLESFREAQTTYEGMSSKEKQEFDSYPIRNLWNYPKSN